MPEIVTFFLKILVEYHIMLILIAFVDIVFIYYVLKVKGEISRDTKCLTQKLNSLLAEAEDQRFKLFDEWITQRSKVTPVFNNAWNAFYDKYRSAREGVFSTPNIHHYFLEEDFVQIRGQRKLIELLSGICLALGILGTFIGLTYATVGVPTNGDSEAIRSGITGLISGMSVAFWCSILGIASSIGWQIGDRSFYRKWLMEQYYTLVDKLDEVFPAKEVTSILQLMLEKQDEQINDFKIFMTEHLVPQIATGMKDALMDTFVPHLEKTETMMESVFEQTNQNQLSGMRKMVDNFVQSLNELTGDQMKSLESALRQTVELQEKVHKEMSHLVDSLERSAEKQSVMVEKTTTLTEEIHGYTGKLSDYQEVLENTIGELNITTLRNKDLQLVMSDLLTKMTEERKAFDEQFLHHSGLLQNNLATINEHTTTQNKLNEQYEELMKQCNTGMEQIELLQGGNINLTSRLMEQGKNFNEMNTTFDELLSKITENGRITQSLYSDIILTQQQVAGEKAEITHMKDQLHHSLREQLDHVDQRSLSMKEQWDGTHEMMQEINHQLSHSSQQFMEQIHKGLEHTFKRFDKELTKSVQLLSSGINALEELLEHFPVQMEKFHHHVGEINHKLGDSIQETNNALHLAIKGLTKETDQSISQAAATEVERYVSE